MTIEIDNVNDTSFLETCSQCFFRWRHQGIAAQAHHGFSPTPHFMQFHQPRLFPSNRSGAVQATAKLFLKQEAHQVVGRGDTQRHSTWKYVSAVTLRQTVDCRAGPVLRTLCSIQLHFSSQPEAALDVILAFKSNLSVDLVLDFRICLLPQIVVAYARLFSCGSTLTALDKLYSVGLYGAHGFHCPPVYATPMQQI